MLICVICLQLSKESDFNEEIEEELADDESGIESIKVQPFDEDAEVQARIWNAFTREKYGVESTASATSIVTPAQIYQSLLDP